MKTLKFLGILLIGLLMLASPANATGYRMIMMAGGVEAAMDPGNDSYTKLLMHMEGTDDAQVFTDSSVGNLVEVDAGTGFSDAFGVFDGTGDWLSIASHADFAIGTGAFTIEAWVNFSTDADVGEWIVGPDDANHFDLLYVGGTNLLTVYLEGSNYTFSWTPVIGKWYHVAVSRSGTDLRAFIDGTQIGATETSNDNVAQTAIRIGVQHNDAGALTGFMDEVRISNVARYTANFTPSTENFTSDANTKLLLHMDLPNTDPQSFVDSGNTGHTVTDNGGVYQKARNLGIIGTSCLYLPDAGTNYLSAPDSADWDFGTGDFTFEALACFLDSDNHGHVIYNHYQDASNYVTWYFEGVAEIAVFFIKLAGANTYYTCNWVYSLNTWYHLAIVRAGTADGDWAFYVDGVEISGSFSSGNGAIDITAMTGDMVVGSYNKSSEPFHGYLDDLRIVKGTAVYTANFNPPTSPLTAITNTKLLLHFDNGEGSVSFDDDGNTDHTVTANGNAIQVIGHGCDAEGNVKTENTAYKFGSTAAYFDGTGDYITLSDSTDWDIVANTDDATVDFWVKHDDHAGTEVYVVQFEDANNQWVIYHVHGTGIYFNVQSASSSVVQINSGDEITDTDWHHIALVKDATVYKLYLDGTEIGTTTDASVDTFAGSLLIGSDGTSAFAGYIDELRISKGIARWTANFTPPNAAYYE